ACEFIRRLEYQSKKSAPFVAMSKNGILDLAARDVVTEDKILIRNRLFILERYLRSIRSEIYLLNIVRRRANLLDLDARIQVYLDGNIASVSCRGNRGRDLRGIFNRSRNIAWGDGHRKNEFIRAVLILQSLDIADLDHYFVARHYIGNRLRKDIR